MDKVVVGIDVSKGGLEAVVAGTLGAAGLPVAGVDPAQVRAFSQGAGSRSKPTRTRRRARRRSRRR